MCIDWKMPDGEFIETEAALCKWLTANGHEIKESYGIDANDGDFCLCNSPYDEIAKDISCTVSYDPPLLDAFVFTKVAGG